MSQILLVLVCIYRCHRHWFSSREVYVLAWYFYEWCCFNEGIWQRAWAGAYIVVPLFNWIVLPWRPSCRAVRLLSTILSPCKDVIHPCKIHKIQVHLGDRDFLEHQFTAVPPNSSTLTSKIFWLLSAARSSYLCTF